MKKFKGIIFVILIISGISCKDLPKKAESSPQLSTNEPEISSGNNFIKEIPSNKKTPSGMVWIPGGKFIQGSLPNDDMAMMHENPAHEVVVDGFFMDITEVTNSEFKKFVDETEYVTVAEREIIWEEMKKQLPPGTPRPHDSILQPGSLIFKKTKSSVPNLYDYSQWWEWKIGANWKHPYGPETNIEGKENYPVVHIAYEDAQAYCKWAGRRLPTEAEWELAARAGKPENRFTWGNSIDNLSQMANTWEGEFPTSNTKADNYEGIAPVKSYPPNPLGLYDMAGNVWEYTQDWYNGNYYKSLTQQGVAKNPQGAQAPFNPNMPQAREKVIKGGSFLCHASYCASFRISARMANSLDSSQEHLGFRTVVSAKDLNE